MQEYAQILNYAIPFFIVLIAIEYGASCFMHLKVNRLFDTISSLSSGVTNVLKDILGLSIAIISYKWMVEHLAIFSINTSWILYVLAFIGLDFAGYWSHRFSHEINLFWNRHIIHHSSEEYNLACALRQSVSEVFAVFTILFLPMALLGVPTSIVAVVAPLHLFAQFWYHTRLIDKMGILEYILVTPSHHRVHHAINPIYMDKNYSQIFIFWDKLFGTFQPELKEEVAVFGVSKPVKTWNPWLINFQHLWQLYKDAWRTKSWYDKLRIWVMPTGWRPADVAAKYPIQYTTDIHHRPKYDTSASMFMNIWMVLQFVISLVLMMYLFNNIGEFAYSSILLYGIFIFVTIFSFTSLMDGSWMSIPAEVIKTIFGFFLIWMHDMTWFGIDEVLPYGTINVMTYLIISMLLACYFYYLDRPVVREYRDFAQ
ncbi:MAG TPA: sterol desaturase family protein [Saprospiraceae bacterium]|nr:sterol desaturase family protein [Saprospiraceae bacterium]